MWLSPEVTLVFVAGVAVYNTLGRAELEMELGTCRSMCLEKLENQDAGRLWDGLARSGMVTGPAGE